jgi:hypothetical protein
MGMSSTKELTKGQKLIEIARCLKDPIYAIETYLYTEDRTQGGEVPFRLFPKQKELVHGYVDHRHNIVMKPRQAGISTTTAAYAAVLTALSNPKSKHKILIAANKQETAKEFLKKIRDFTRQLPDWMDIYRPANGKDWFSPDKNSDSHYRLNNGSEVKAVASSKDALRGYTPSIIIVDEAAFIEGSRGEEFYEAAQPSLSTGGRCILISTPNGYDPLYHKTYKLAKLGKNNYNTVDMKWYEDPRYNGRNKSENFLHGMTWNLLDEKSGEVVESIFDPCSGDINHYTIKSKGTTCTVPQDTWDEMIEKGYTPTSGWFESMCSDLNHNPRSIAQELLCSFLGSGDNVIDDKYVKRQEKDNVRPPIRKEWIDGNMWIWEDPIKDHQYILAADPSSGSAADAAGICIFDYVTGHQVAEYQGKVAPDILGEMCAHYGSSYDAHIVVDITGGWGAATVLKLIDLGYPKKKLYYDITVGIDAIENNKSLQKHMDNGKLPGLNFQKNRNVIISELEKGIRMDTFKLRSARALMEMDTFVYINGRPDHMKGYHDDLLMSIGMCMFVAMSSFKDLEKSKGQSKAIVESWVVTSTDSNDVDTLSRNVDFYMANNEVNRVQAADSPHNWVFGGMYGFRKGDKRR